MSSELESEDAWLQQKYGKPKRPRKQNLGRRCANVYRTSNGVKKRCTKLTKHPSGYCAPCRREEGYE